MIWKDGEWFQICLTDPHGIGETLWHHNRIAACVVKLRFMTSAWVFGERDVPGLPPCKEYDFKKVVAFKRFKSFDKAKAWAETLARMEN
jgi:hypothetical protein